MEFFEDLRKECLDALRLPLSNSETEFLQRRWLANRSTNPSLASKYEEELLQKRRLLFKKRECAISSAHSHICNWISQSLGVSAKVAEKIVGVIWKYGESNEESLDFLSEIAAALSDEQGKAAESDLISRSDLFRKLCLVKSPDGKYLRIPDADVDGFPNTIAVKDVRKAIVDAPTIYLHMASEANVDPVDNSLLEEIKPVFFNCSECDNKWFCKIEPEQCGWCLDE